MAAAKNRFQFIQDCALLVRVAPTPISFAERRSVLQVLEQHGQFEFFQMRPGRHNSYMSVTKQAATARRLVTNSPLTYKISIPRTTVDTDYMGLGRPRNIGNELAPTTVEQGDESADLEDQGSTEAKPEQEEKQFTLEIFPARVREHNEAIIKSPLSNPWPAKARGAGLINVALKQSLPWAPSTAGLSQWLQDFGDRDIGSSKNTRIQAVNSTPSAIKAKLELDKANGGSFNKSRHSRGRSNRDEGDKAPWED